MGNSESRLSIPGGATTGYHVLRVAANSPADHAGLSSFFDFLIAIGNTRLDKENDTLKVVIEEHMERPLELTVYNSKTDTVRQTQIIPSNSWGGQGKLGVSIRFCDFSNSSSNVWHVLEVQPNSPAAIAGLLSDSDYILGAESVLNQAEDLIALVQSYEGKTVKLYVYNVDSDDVREVSLIPNRNWSENGSDSFLGCDIGYGYLHRIPSYRDRPQRTPAQEQMRVDQPQTNQYNVAPPMPLMADLNIQNLPHPPPAPHPFTPPLNVPVNPYQNAYAAPPTNTVYTAPPAFMPQEQEIKIETAPNNHLRQNWQETSLVNNFQNQCGVNENVPANNQLNIGQPETQQSGHSHDDGHGHSHDDGHGHSHDDGHGHSHDDGHGHSQREEHAPEMYRPQTMSPQPPMQAFVTPSPPTVPQPYYHEPAAPTEVERKESNPSSQQPPQFFMQNQAPQTPVHFQQPVTTNYFQPPQPNNYYGQQQQNEYYQQQASTMPPANVPQMMPPQGNVQMKAPQSHPQMIQPNSQMQPSPNAQHVPQMMPPTQYQAYAPAVQPINPYQTPSDYFGNNSGPPTNYTNPFFGNEPTQQYGHMAPPLAPPMFSDQHKGLTTPPFCSNPTPQTQPLNFPMPPLSSMGINELVAPPTNLPPVSDKNGYDFR